MTLPLQNRDREGAEVTYLITFACYGAWLPGQAGAIPVTQNAFGARFPEADAGKEQRARNEMSQEPYVLDATRRQLVLGSLQEVCSCRGWRLLAAHVRTNHVHMVVGAGCKPELVMNAVKAYSSRVLNRVGQDGSKRRRWARHGSTRYLWASAAVSAAIEYVVRGQGEPMALYEMDGAR